MYLKLIVRGTTHSTNSQKSMRCWANAHQVSPSGQHLPWRGALRVLHSSTNSPNPIPNLTAAVMQQLSHTDTFVSNHTCT